MVINLPAIKLALMFLQSHKIGLNCVMANRTITAFVLFLLFYVRASNLQPRIYGGIAATIRDFPHSVYMTAECNKVTWICGASILNQRILLTAGHCVNGCVGKYSIRAYAGHDDIGQVSHIIKTRFYSHKP